MSSSSSSPPDPKVPTGANSNRSSSDEQGSSRTLPQEGFSLHHDTHQPLQPPPPSETTHQTSTNLQRNPPSILSQTITSTKAGSTLTTKPQVQTQTPSSPKDQDFFASIRRSIDESISSTLHSIFGLPSSLKTPSSSNWMIRDEDYDRDRPTKPGSKNDDDDNKGSGWPGSSSSAGPSAPSNSGGGPTSPNSSRVMGDLSSLLGSPISSILLSLGLTSTHLLEQGFRTAHQELSQMAERHERLRQEHQQAMEQHMKQNNFDDQRDHSNSVREITSSSGRQCSRQRHRAQDPFGFWAEFFGEDMFGHNRTHPLFSSFFDEFLPDSPFGRHGSPPVGGQTETTTRNPWRWSDDAFFSTFDEHLRQAFRESLRQAEQMHDMHLLRLGFPAGHAYEPSEQTSCSGWGTSNPHATSNAILAAIERRNKLEQHEREHPKSESSESGSGFLWNFTKGQTEKSEEDEKRLPDTELDLYDYYDKKETTDNTQDGEKKLVFTSKTSVMSQDASGVVTSRIIEESRYSDGSVERVDRTNEEEPNMQRLISQSSTTPDYQRGLPFSFAREQNSQFHEAFAKERQKFNGQGSDEAAKCPRVKKESKPSSLSSDSQQTNAQDRSSQDGGWRSFFWASDKE